MTTVADPAAGLWESPGGMLEPGETTQQAAVREWEEETGLKLPPGHFTGGWVSSNGVYEGFTYQIDHEVDLDHTDATRAEDPDGDGRASLAWWHPEHMVNHPALRPELAADLPLMHAALRGSKDLQSEMRDRRGRWTRGASPDQVKGAFDGIALKGKPNGLGTKGNPIAVGTDLNRAVTLLGQGKHIRLDQPIQVGTLLDKLAAVVHDAQAHGDRPQHFDLCKVSVAGTNLFCAHSRNVPRAKMPQLKGFARPGTPAWDRAGGRGDVKVSFEEDFKNALAAIGLPTHPVTLPASHLKASQSELSGIGVAEMVKGIKSGVVPDRPIFVTRDGYVIDGHHRWAANVAIDTQDNKLGDVTMKTDMINMDIGAALDFAQAFVAAMGIASKAHGQTTPAAKVDDLSAYEAMADRLDMLAARPAMETKRDVTGELRGAHGRWSRSAGSLADALSTRQSEVRTGIKDPAGAQGALLDDPTSMKNLPEDVQAQLLAHTEATYGVNPEQMHANLTSVLERGLADPSNGGALWYGHAGEQARQIAHDTGYTPEQTVGATAALSPQTEWGANIAMTEYVAHVARANPQLDAHTMDLLTHTMLTKKFGKGADKRVETRSMLAWAQGEAMGKKGVTWPTHLADTHLADHPPMVEAALIKAMAQVGLYTSDGKQLSYWDDVLGKKSRVSFSSGLDGLSKALRILHGTPPADVLGGHKVRSFYNNILLAESNPFADVTIDTHAISAAAGKKIPSASPLITKGFATPSVVGIGLKGPYPVFADAYRRIAAEHGLAAHQAQAITWLQWRKEHPGRG